ncbi:MAG: M56 family metallopeptidase [Ruminococcaceae bacterium]|nr:M56 family metallopeptidase [Oscillospiraceae bacterium]
MFDIWGFLLQTYTVSGVGALILLIKALFKDKLSPKWQFAVWSVLGIIMLLPAGMFGRYTLFRWQIPIEIMKSGYGDYGFTKVLFPFPVITSMPRTQLEWLYALYVLGVLVHVFFYGISYAKLHRAVRRGDEPSPEKCACIQAIAAAHGIKLGRIVEVSGLPSAFVYGIFRPTLVLPKENELNEKIVLHELFHLKNRDTLWSVIICFFRCLHWCNPLIVYCANRAINDMESRCDQYVLERLEGEERREYGHILLSMANERFSKTPGSTCINNGGKNIRARIENIARFKKYPQGMGLVSVCVIILIALPLVVGVQATNIRAFSHSVELTLASARSIPCTTPAGAFDTYGKSVLERNGYYRAMCAPEDMQEAILKEMLEKDDIGIFPIWDPGIDEWANKQEGFYIYNLKHVGDAYEGLFVIELNYPPSGKPAEINMTYLAVQNLRVENENGRWVAIPLEAFRYVETLSQSLSWGCLGLPGITYVGEANDWRIEATYQTIHTIDLRVPVQREIVFLLGAYSNTTPDPNAEFSRAARSNSTKCVYIGRESDKDKITRLGLSVEPVYEGEKRPTDMRVPSGDNTVSSSNLGAQTVSKKLNPGWSSPISMDGGGGSADPNKDIEHPAYFAADLYINNEKVATLDLILQEGEAQ